jgi:hypothetical protein
LRGGRLAAHKVARQQVSHFEYISVAVSLVYSLILAKLLGALPASLHRDRRYWVHSIWVVNLLLATLGSWWEIWSYREVVWTPTGCFTLIAIPSIVYLRAAVLLSDRSREVRSWRDHYYSVRGPFFLLQLVGSIHFATAPWIISGAMRPGTTLIGSASFGVLAALAAGWRAPRLHETVALLGFIAYFAAFFLQRS